ncbi:MAG: porin [Pseudomonadota bacterium]
MKKLLITSTALVVASGAAFADGHTGVKLSGYAEIGVKDNGNGDVQFHHDMDVSFKLSGETDGGLTFGAKVDLDEIDNSSVFKGNADPLSGDASPATVFIAGDSWKITMGDTDNALDAALTEVAFLTALADDHSTHSGYSGNSGFDADGQNLRFDYSFDSFSLHASYAQANNGASSTNDAIALGAKFSTDLGGTSIGVGVGYNEAGTGNEIFGISLTAGIAGFDVVLNYWDGEIASVDETYTAIGVNYTIDALSLTANYGEFDSGAEGFGVAANYDLGGGAVVMFGYSDDNVGDQWSLGLGLSF